MSKKKIYAGLTVVGAVLPLVFFVQWTQVNGVDFATFVEALFANKASGMFTVDLLFSSMVFWVWMFRDSYQNKVGHAWLPVIFNLCVGLSMAFPLYLYMRERRLNQTATVST